jgi:hypothetical protein
MVQFLELREWLLALGATSISCADVVAVLRWMGKSVQAEACAT